VEQVPDKRKAGFQAFMKYKGASPLILITGKNWLITGMSGMVVLIDTNIILDHLISRSPYILHLRL
jgi:hypothetical protein